MTYKFNSDDAATNDAANPFKIENCFLLLSSGLLVAGGIAVLLTARNHLQLHEDKLATVSMVLALGLFGLAIHFTIQALSQLRFVLGRRFPRGLADEIPFGTYGLAEGAAEVIRTLRDRAIEFPEPRGPLNGLLYSLVKPLMTAPPPLQVATVWHFHNMLAMGVMLISLVFSFVLFQHTAYEGIVSWLYLPMTGLSILTPLSSVAFSNPNQRGVTGSSSNSNEIFWKLIALVVFAIVAPVAVPRFAPSWDIPPMWLAPALLIIGSLGASALFLGSLIAQPDTVKHTSVSCEQTTISMNCHPAQLWTQIGRDFQDNWIFKVPNRSYADVPPGLTEAAPGTFRGYILQETQPIGLNSLDYASLGKNLTPKYVRFLLSLNGWGLLLSAGAAGIAFYEVPLFAQMGHLDIMRVFLSVFALGLVTTVAYRTAHLLWSRMYFTSRLTWIDVDGTSQKSELSVGNQFSGNVRSKSTLTRIEDATLRVWVADITSVAFGKNGNRFIIAMSAADGYAKSTAERLIHFAAEQSSVTVPTSSNDVAKAGVIHALDRNMNANLNDAAGLIGRGMPAPGPMESEERGFGKIKLYDPSKRFGFITTSNGVDYYFSWKHLDDIQLKAGAPVSFTLVAAARGIQATNVQTQTDQ
jgi:cold shock CspA family protein